MKHYAASALKLASLASMTLAAAIAFGFTVRLLDVLIFEMNGRSPIHHLGMTIWAASCLLAWAIWKASKRVRQVTIFRADLIEGLDLDGAIIMKDLAEGTTK